MRTARAPWHWYLLRLIDGQSRTPPIIDLGCGFGDFLRFLRAAGHTVAVLSVTTLRRTMILEGTRPSWRKKRTNGNGGLSGEPAEDG